MPSPDTIVLVARVLCACAIAGLLAAWVIAWAAEDDGSWPWEE